MHQTRRLLRLLAKFPDSLETPDEKVMQYASRRRGYPYIAFSGYALHKRNFFGRVIRPLETRINVMDECLTFAANRGYIDPDSYKAGYLLITRKGRTFISWKGAFYASEVLSGYGPLNNFMFGGGVAAILAALWWLYNYLH